MNSLRCLGVVLLVVFLTSPYISSAATSAKDTQSDSVRMYTKPLMPLKLAGINCGTFDLASARNHLATGTLDQLGSVLSQQDAFKCFGKNLFKSGCTQTYLNIKDSENKEMGGIMLMKKKGKECVLVQDYWDRGDIYNVTKSMQVRTACPVTRLSKAIAKEKPALLKSPGEYVASIFVSTIFTNAFMLMAIDSGGGLSASETNTCTTEVFLR